MIEGVSAESRCDTPAHGGLPTVKAHANTPLTDVATRQAKPGPKATKLTDDKGMFLLITAAGGKLWRLKYRFEGKEKLLAMGTYPAVSLNDARKRREDARALLAKGKDPSREKQRDKIRARMEAADRFKAIAIEYCAKRRRDGENGNRWRSCERCLM